MKDAKTQREQLKQIVESFVRFDILSGTQHMLSLVDDLKDEALKTEMLQLQMSYRILLHRIETEHVSAEERNNLMLGMKRRGLQLHGKLLRAKFLLHENTVFAKTFHNVDSRDWKTLWREAIDMDERTKLQDEIFDFLWTCPHWKEADRLWWQDFVEHQNELVLRHWLGAITQSLWMFWDEQKVFLLTHFTHSSHDNVRAQAVLGCIIVIRCYPDYYVPSFEHPSPYTEMVHFHDDVVLFQREFIRMKESEKVEAAETEAMEKVVEKESKEEKMERELKLIKQFNQRKIHHRLDLSFSKRYLLHICTFLTKTSHWWAPFDESRSEVVKACYDEQGNVRQEYELLIEASHECDLQHYLSCFMLSGNNVRLEIQGDVPEDFLDHVDRTPLPIHKRLIHNLYRINYQSPSHKYMKDIFDTVSFLENPYLKSVFTDEDVTQTTIAMCEIELSEVRKEHLEEVVKHNGLSVELAQTLAQCCILQQEDYATALAYLEKADLLSEANALQLRNMAFCAHKMRKYDREVDYLKRLRHVEPDNITPLLTLANLYYQQKKFKEAAPALQELTYRLPEEIRAWGQLVFTYIFLEQYDEAKKNVLRVEQDFPSHPLAYFISGCYALATGVWHEAIDYFRKMSKSDFDQNFHLLDELPISLVDKEIIYDSILRQ